MRYALHASHVIALLVAVSLLLYLLALPAVVRRVVSSTFEDLGYPGATFAVRTASLTTRAGAGLAVHANADAHVRACLAGDRVLLHVLTDCNAAPVTLKKGDHLTGTFTITLHP